MDGTVFIATKPHCISSGVGRYHEWQLYLGAFVLISLRNNGWQTVIRRRCFEGSRGAELQVPSLTTLERNAQKLFWEKRGSGIVCGKGSIVLKNTDYGLNVLLLSRTQLSHRPGNLILHFLLVDPAVEGMTIFV